MHGERPRSSATWTDLANVSRTHTQRTSLLCRLLLYTSLPPSLCHDDFGTSSSAAGSVHRRSPGSDRNKKNGATSARALGPARRVSVLLFRRLVIEARKVSRRYAAAGLTLGSARSGSPRRSARRSPEIPGISPNRENVREQKRRENENREEGRKREEIDERRIDARAHTPRRAGTLETRRSHRFISFLALEKANFSGIRLAVRCSRAEGPFSTRNPRVYMSRCSAGVSLPFLVFRAGMQPRRGLRVRFTIAGLDRPKGQTSESVCPA